MNDLVFRAEKALHPDTCRELVRIYDECEGASSETDHSGFKVVRCFQHVPSRDDQITLKWTIRTGWYLAKMLDVAVIYPETALLARLGIGGRHPAHADNCRLEDGKWVPNHSPNRVVSGLFYLNEDFEGGELVVAGIKIKPITGLFVAFPSGSDYVHEVLPVTSGLRYSLPIWFTDRQAMQLAL